MTKSTNFGIDKIVLTLLKYRPIDDDGALPRSFAISPRFEAVEMVSTNKPGDRVAMVQMNAELRNAQLELLSAQCATDRLRLRFSVEDVARNGQREILLKAVSSANALCDYYNYLAHYLPKESNE